MQGLPFRKITKFMTKRLAAVAIRNLNSFLSDNGMSSEHIPLSIMTNAPPLDARSHPLDFGAHVEVFEDNGFTHNSNNARSTPAIALGPSSYRKPGQIFMSLVAGRRLRRKR